MREDRLAMPRPLGVKTGKAQNEQMLSGLPPIADMRDGVPDFRLVPIATESTAAKSVLIRSPRRRADSFGQTQIVLNFNAILHLSHTRDKG